MRKYILTLLVIFGVAVAIAQTEVRTEITINNDAKYTISTINTDKNTIFTWVVDGSIVMVSEINTSVEVYNILGQKVIQQPILIGHNEIQSLKRGQVYIVKLGNKAQKVSLN